MEHRFEDWYEKKINSEDAKEIFAESSKCFSVGAYRASFIMSYLGFQIVLKERILKNTKEPKEISSTLWSEISGKLRDDNTWDDVVSEVVKRKNPARIFLINDDIAEQYLYFRRIRNACAHAKSNIISYSHVETFWLFMQSNINRFIINGGTEGLMERIIRHYDPSFTRPNSDISPIVEDINTYMEFAKIPDFLMEAYHFFDKEVFIDSTFSKGKHGCDFWEKVIFSTNGDLVKAFYEFIKRDWSIFFSFIDSYPERLIYALETGTEEFKRNFWYEQLRKIFRGSYENQWLILNLLFKNGIIPEEEKERLLYKIIDTKEIPPEEVVEFLKTTDYFKLLKNNIFGSGNNFNSPNGIDYGNYNWARIKFLIKHVELDDEIVSQLNKAFLFATYGTFYEGLEDLLLTNMEIKEAYIKILKSKNRTIPECLK